MWTPSNNWQFGQHGADDHRGLGYRWSGDRTASLTASGFVPGLQLSTRQRFVQDEITLVADRLKFTVGGNWSTTVSPASTAARRPPAGRPRNARLGRGVARAVRNLNRADTGANFDAMCRLAEPGQPPPSAAYPGNRQSQYRQRNLIAYEAGWRMQVTPKISVDGATFQRLHRSHLGQPDPAATFFEATPAASP